MKASRGCTRCFYTKERSPGDECVCFFHARVLSVQSSSRYELALLIEGVELVTSWSSSIKISVVSSREGRENILRANWVSTGNARHVSRGVASVVGMVRSSRLSMRLRQKSSAYSGREGQHDLRI